MSEPLRCAIVQAPPVFLNLAASVDRALELLGQASRDGARLVACLLYTSPSPPDS